MIEYIGGGTHAYQLYEALAHAFGQANDKKALREKTGISTASIAKLNKGENVITDVLVRICTALNCDLNDIMELVPDTDDPK